jgi:hypothetical protein
MRVLGIAAMCATLGGCAFQRAEIAQDAQMVGLPKERVLACMGAPATKAAEGTAEVWGYPSGNGMTVTDASYGRYGGSAHQPILQREHRLCERPGFSGELLWADRRLIDCG